MRPITDLSRQTLYQRYASGTLTVGSCIEQILARIAVVDRAEVWITRVSDVALMAQAAQLDAQLSEHGAALLTRLPLFGIPFAVKDNIDVAGLPTTAACPEFAYVPGASATVVQKLTAAGAIVLGKTNLDQFATGLVGTRSPYGAVRNAHHPEYVSGGSSSGSAVAVALGLVSFALGTDTAGSGRVPAGFNNIVGLKPTYGLLSTRGVVPACRSLDCVSIFANTVADAWAVTQIAAGFDGLDSGSCRVPMQGVKRRAYKIALPSTLEFYGDTQAQQAFEQTVEKLKQHAKVEIGLIDFAAFKQAANLLYQGPWVAERMASVKDFFANNKAAINPVVAGIMAQANDYSATDTFKAHYLMAELRQQAEHQLQDYDLLLVPTAPTMPTIAAVEAEPVKRNSELGYYTNFVNFFDMAALAIPALARADGLPSGITLVGKAGADQMLAAAAEELLPCWHTLEKSVVESADAASKIAPSQTDYEATCSIAFDPLPFCEPTVKLAVVGAHLQGQPLNWQLLERGARKLATTTTSACYRLYALPNTTPLKPGLARVDNAGTNIEVEVWELPLRRFGDIVAEVPAPLAIGSLELADGTWVKGFVCEPLGLSGAQDISSHGGWRNYLGSF